ncbi:response regulator transcription factor [Streptomyces griseoaurantiacus]|uniref:response regulator transcription factor n=1 Tax=Streptomyces griseoaurantiacus TaxID=68213 RepID=UPI00379CE058
MRLLLVEGEDRIAAPLTEGLSRHGYTVDRARTGAEALAARASDLVLLDLGLPGADGLDVCRALRARSAAPIVLIGVRGEEDDRRAGLAAGADDYLVKPFGVREVAARLRAVTRRTRHRDPAPPATGPGPEDATLGSGPAPHATAGRRARHLGPLTVDRHTRRAALGGAPLTLTPDEFDVLACLAGDPGAVRFRRQITDEVWGTHFLGPFPTLDAHVAALRRKLGDPAWITTVRRTEYRLAAPPEDAEDVEDVEDVEEKHKGTTAEG